MQLNMLVLACLVLCNVLSVLSEGPGSPIYTFLE